MNEDQEKKISIFRWHNGGVVFYKIKIPEGYGKMESIFNEGSKHKIVGGDVWLVCRKGESKHGEQIYLEYNWQHGNFENFEEKESNGNGKIKYFAESYVGINSIPFLMKCLMVFEELKNYNGFPEKYEYYQIVDRYFGDYEVWIDGK